MTEKTEQLRARLQAVADRRHDPIRISLDKTRRSKAAREARRRARTELKILNAIMDVLEHQENAGQTDAHFLRQAAVLDGLHASVNAAMPLGIHAYVPSAVADVKETIAKFDREIARTRRWLEKLGIDVWTY